MPPDRFWRALGGWALPTMLAAALTASFLAEPLGSLYERFSVEGNLYKLRQAHDVIRYAYVEPSDSQTLFDGAVRGMMEKLDRYSEYLTPEQYNEFNEMVEGRFGGIGVQVDPSDVLTVIIPIPGTPAFEAGILAGDRILEIDGLSTKGMASDEAIRRIRGEPGTEVVLTVVHPGQTQPIKIAVKRTIIHIQSVKAAILRRDGIPVGYLRIKEFQSDTVEAFEHAARDLLAKAVQGLILDLRFNPGGTLEAAVKIADLLLEEGVIVRTQGRLSQSTREFRAAPGSLAGKLPLVVLVNRGSASSSEVLAAALQENKRAPLVGARTFGKAGVQQILPLDPDRSAVKLTTSWYTTPSGRMIDQAKAGEEHGLFPDHLVELSAEETQELTRAWSREEIVPPPGTVAEMFIDRQLAKALAVVTAEFVIK